MKQDRFDHNDDHSDVTKPVRAQRIEVITGVERRRRWVKLLFWDQTGLCLMTKRLEDGKFRWPKVEDGVMRLSPAQLSALLEGLDWARVHTRRVARPTATQ